MITYYKVVDAYSPAALTDRVNEEMKLDKTLQPFGSVSISSAEAERSIHTVYAQALVRYEN